jgi:hypothetical protein
MNGATIVDKSAFGVNPAEIKNIVKMPHAINAGIFGIIIPERKVPNFWIAILAELRCAATSVVI